MKKDGNLDRVMIFGAPLSQLWRQPGTHENVKVLKVLKTEDVVEQVSAWLKCNGEDPSQYERQQGSNCWFCKRGGAPSLLAGVSDKTFHDCLFLGVLTGTAGTSSATADQAG